MWIESHQSLRNHPKVKKAARLAGITEPEVVGFLHYLWWWALDYAQDGDITKYDNDDIESAVDWKGERGLLIKTLIGCGYNDHPGFIEVTSDGERHIHDWMEYGGRLLEMREFNSERARRKRDLYDNMQLTRTVKRRDGDKCRYCGVEVDWNDRKGTKGGTYDHIDPDGDNSEDNLVVCCRSCNSKKNRRTPEQANMRLIDLPEIYQESGENLLLQNKQNKQNNTEQNKPSGAEKAPRTTAKQIHNESIDALTKIFTQWTSIPCPSGNGPKGTVATRWYAPLNRIWTLCDKDTTRSAELIQKAIERMRQEKLIISAPQSIEKIAMSIFGEGNIAKSRDVAGDWQRAMQR